MKIIKLKILSILASIIIISGHATSPAKDLDIKDIEQALGIKKKDSCSTPPCPVDVDSLLDKLNREHSKERENINSANTLNDSQKSINDSKNNPLVKMGRAELIILNKITAKPKRSIFKLGEVKFFGNLSVEVHKCIKSTNPFNNNNLMLLTVLDNKIENDNLSVFHGWVMSSNPSLSTIEHPVYEVLPIQCLEEETQNKEV